MQHWVGIIGCSIGIIGTAALGYDLYKTKTAEETIGDFKLLQDELNNSSQVLTVRINEGLNTVIGFLSGYLSFLEIEAELKEEGGDSKAPKAPDPGLDTVRQLFSEHSQAEVRSKIVEGFAEARKSLASPEVIEKALKLTADVRRRIESHFAEQVALSHKLRWVAMSGVLLVGIGAIAQLIDLFSS